MKCYSTRQECTSCQSPFKVFNGTCNDCVSGYYYGYPNNSYGTCIKCLSVCAECNSSTSCTVCNVGYYLYEQTCISTCPSGYYASSSGVCTTCPTTNCSSCPNGICQSCKPPTYKLYLNNTLTCSSNCPTSTYLDTTVNTCITCSTNCTICTSISSCT